MSRDRKKADKIIKQIHSRLEHPPSKTDSILRFWAGLDVVTVRLCPHSHEMQLWKQSSALSTTLQSKYSYLKENNFWLQQ